MGRHITAGTRALGLQSHASAYPPAFSATMRLRLISAQLLLWLLFQCASWQSGEQYTITCGRGAGADGVRGNAGAATVAKLNEGQEPHPGPVAHT